MKILKKVQQEKRTECGVACVAVLAGISLQAARRLLGHSQLDKTGWTNTADLRAALAKRNIHLGRENYSDSWENIHSKLVRGLIAVNDHNIGQDNQRWHWVVYDKVDGLPPIIDPQSKLERRNPSAKLRAYSYFYVKYNN